MLDHTNDLNAALVYAHEALDAAVVDRESSSRLVTFVTVGLDVTPRARTVVLRSFCSEICEATFHTDVRTLKVAELRRVPKAEFVFWDATRELQLRLSGTVSVHSEDEVAQLAWRYVDIESRFNYLTDATPGSEVGRPTSGREGMDGRLPTQQEGAAGWQNFAVLVMMIKTIDLVLLDNAGHRRARFKFGERGLTGSGWLVP